MMGAGSQRTMCVVWCGKLSGIGVRDRERRGVRRDGHAGNRRGMRVIDSKRLKHGQLYDMLR
jgi:hypothetical protein